MVVNNISSRFRILYPNNLPSCTLTEVIPEPTETQMATIAAALQDLQTSAISRFFHDLESELVETP